MTENFLDSDDIVTRLPYEIRVVPMTFSLGQSEEEKIAQVQDFLRPGELYRLDAIIRDAEVPTDPYDRINDRYQPDYVQNVIIVKKKEF